MIFLPIALVLILFDLYRAKRLGKPIMKYKNKIYDDRFIEFIFVVVSIVIGLMTFILMYKLGAREAFNKSLPYIISGLIVLVFLMIEYNRNGIGIFENGILFKSRFTKWEDIYTYRSYDMESGKIKITYFIHEYLNRANLWKQNVLLSHEDGLEMESIIDKRLDRNKS